MPKSDALLGHHGQSPNDAAARMTHTMEPECREIFGVHSDITPLMSIAISLKRIADMLEETKEMSSSGKSCVRTFQVL